MEFKSNSFSTPSSFYIFVGEKEGDEIFGATSPLEANGFHAEYAIVNEHYVAKKPPNVGFNEMASIGFAGLTAYRALVDYGNVQNGQNVLILGGSGGIGTFAIQYLKHLNCQIDVTCSPASSEMVQKLGARRAYDYDDKISEKYQLVLDCLGDESRTRAFELVHKGGRLVSVRGDLISLMDERGVIPGLFSAMVELGIVFMYILNILVFLN